jgi:4-amino-4-deoxy-L-arabinose transferase-like glycosyltransferase
MKPEPTVWDFVKAALTPWQDELPTIPALADDGTAVIEKAPGQQKTGPFPVFTLLALGLALIAQNTLEPIPGSERIWLPGFLCYGMALLWLFAAIWRGEWQLGPHRPDGEAVDPETVHGPFLIIGSMAALAAFWLMGHNRFTWLNVSLWMTALLAMLMAFWLPSTPFHLQEWFKQTRAKLAQRKWQLNITLTRWTLVCLLALGIILFLRFYRLAEVPPEMTSDHAEKLLDVGDILQGKTSIFFIRNTGREPFQFYLTALVIKLFKTGISFISLKLGTSLAGLLLIGYLYALGKEVGNRRVGLFAMLLGGSSYWLNTITRIGLRFSLLPLFTAPMMYHLLRGLRTRNRNHFLLAGLYLGIGLHGYSPYRVVPLLVLVAVGLYLLHAQSRGARAQTLWGLTSLVIISLIVFLPLARFMTDPANPYRDMFLLRAATRLSDVEKPINGNPLLILITNMGKALVMFFWDNGNVWSVSVMGRPALDIVSAALYFLGGAALFVRYVVRRHWLDITLLLSVPVLLLGSALAVAFPQENPILNRTAGALVPVFVIAALGLDSLLTAWESWRPTVSGTRLAWGLALVLCFFSIRQNYDLVFNQYQTFYRAVSWNSSEIGTVIREFAESAGSYTNAWVIPYPYWVDTRLVGVHAGQPEHDYALQRSNIPQTLDNPGYKLYIVYLSDTETLELLQNLYPQGSQRRYHSAVGKDFLEFIVPGSTHIAPTQPGFEDIFQP